MAEMSNVEYLWKRANNLMGTPYSYPYNNKTQAINVEYVFDAANKIDEEGIQTEPNFRSQMTTSNQYQASDTIFVDKVMSCVNACARSCHSCTGTCYGGCGSCGGCTGACNGGCLTGCNGNCGSNCTGTRNGG